MSRDRIQPKRPVEQPKRLRQSLLSLADSCPYASYLYVLHDGGVASHAMHRGSAFHATVARAVDAMREHGNESIAPDDCKAIMVEVLAEHPEWVIPAGEMDGLRVMCHRWAQAFVLPDPSARAEQAFTMRSGDHTVSGTIDLIWTVGDTLFIRDYKAGWNLYAQDDVFGKDSFTGKARGAKAAQLIAYALLAADGESEGYKIPPGINYFDLRFVFPLYLLEDGAMAERGGVMARPELIESREWLHGLVEKTARGFRENRYVAVPGSHCARCPANHDCPLPAKVRGGSPFERPVRDVAEDWMFLDRDAKALLAELKAYAGVHGPIPIGTDQELSFQKVESSKLSAANKEALMQGEVPKGELFKSSVSTRFGLRKRSA